MSGALGKLKSKIKRGFVMRVTLWLTKGLAKGKFGPVPQKLWLALEGYKTYTGVVIMVLGDAMQTAYSAGICPDCPEWGRMVMGVGGFLAYIGLSDAANREASAFEIDPLAPWPWPKGFTTAPFNAPDDDLGECGRVIPGRRPDPEG